MAGRPVSFPRGGRTRSRPEALHTVQVLVRLEPTWFQVLYSSTVRTTHHVSHSCNTVCAMRMPVWDVLDTPHGQSYILRAAGMLCSHPLLISANNNIHHFRPLYFGSRGRTFLRQQLIDPFLRYVDGARCAVPIRDWSNPVGLRRLPGH